MRRFVGGVVSLVSVPNSSCKSFPTGMFVFHEAGEMV